MDICLEYTSYYTKTSIERVKRVLESIGDTLPMYKFYPAGKKSFILKGPISKKEEIGLGIAKYYNDEKKEWRIPFYKKNEVEYFVRTGIVPDIKKMFNIYFDDNKFLGEFLRNLRLEGFYYESRTAVSSKRLMDILQNLPPHPTPQLFKKIMDYGKEQKKKDLLFPPRVYTEILYLAGKAKKNGLIWYDYREKWMLKGIVVIIGDDKHGFVESIITNTSRYPNPTVKRYDEYDTTIISYVDVSSID